MFSIRSVRRSYKQDNGYGKQQFTELDELENIRGLNFGGGQAYDRSSD
jgi:hypothetical protein